MQKMTKPTKSILKSRRTGYAPWTSKKRPTSLKNTYPENWVELKQRVRERDGNACVKCKRTITQLRAISCWLEVDHIKRLADGGSNSMLNLQTLCNVCHSNRLNHRHIRRRA